MRATLSLLLALSACDGGETWPKDDTADTSDTSDTAAGEGLLAEGFEAALDRTDGCSDTTLHAWDDDGQVGLELSYSGAIAAAAAAGGLEQDLVIGADSLSIIVEISDKIAINYCTDGLSERTVLGTYHAVSGGVHFTMDAPVDAWSDVKASAALSDVLLRDDAGHEVTISSFTLSDVAVLQAWGG